MAGSEDEEVSSVVIRVPTDVKARLDELRIGDESYGSALRRVLAMPGGRRA